MNFPLYTIGWTSLRSAGARLGAASWVLWFFAGLGLAATGSLLVMDRAMPGATGAEAFAVSLLAGVISVPLQLAACLGTSERSFAAKLAAVAVAAAAAMAAACAAGGYVDWPAISGA